MNESEEEAAVEEKDKGEWGGTETSSKDSRGQGKTRQDKTRVRARQGQGFVHLPNFGHINDVLNHILPLHMLLITVQQDPQQ